MKVVDSSFLVALFLPEDVNHKKAKEIFEKEDLFMVPFDIIKETLTVITYKKGIEYSSKIWDFISSSNSFEIALGSSEKIVNFYLSLKKKISFFDASVLYFALTNKAEPCTSDKQLMKVWKTLRKSNE
ncbi:MAG: PIN domain-containing protein [Candidatus Aenigmarchaeota archaeon]|nr:PIN domain-containing protein [Candidatus Aenigmarchaeota archaeon]